MKKQASTLLPALLDLLRQYLALDMAVYAGHATLLLLTASLPLLRCGCWSSSTCCRFIRFRTLPRWLSSFCRISRPSSQWRWT